MKIVVVNVIFGNHCIAMSLVDLRACVRIYYSAGGWTRIILTVRITRKNVITFKKGHSSVLSR